MLKIRLNLKFKLIACLPLNALIVFFTPVHTVAQPVIEEVIVTAQKREQNMQTVGITLQALDENTLRKRLVVRSDDVLDSLVNVSRNAVNNLNSGITIRGVGTNNFHGNVNRVVGVYHDDISMNTPYAGALPVFDLARIELVRGPQNALFGRNSAGGAISHISHKPQLEIGLQGNMQTELGQHQRAAFSTAINYGLSEDNAIRLAAIHSNQGSTFTNQTTGQSGEQTHNAWRAQWRKLIGDENQGDLILNLHSSKLGGVGMGHKAIGLRDPKDATQPCGAQAVSAGSHFSGIAPCQSAHQNNPSLADWNSFYDVSPAKQQLHNKGGFLQVNYDLAPFKLTSITSREQTDLQFSEDLSGDTRLRMVAFQDSSFIQSSQEFRFSSHNNATLPWMFGLYLFDEDLQQATNVRRRLIANNRQTTAYNLLDQNDREYSVYGQIEWPLSDATHLITAARHAQSRKTADSLFGVVPTPESQIPPDQFIGRATVQALTGDTPSTCPPPGLPCTLPYTGLEQKHDHTGINIRLEHTTQQSPLLPKGTLIYGGYSRGFKNGGFDTRALAAFAGTADAPVAPEYLNAFELGIKSEWLKRTLQINTAMFKYDWKNMQTFDVINGVPGFVNIPAVDIHGLEAELNWALPQTIHWQLAVGLLDTNIKNAGQLEGVDESHSLQNSPKVTLTTNVEKHWQTRHAHFTARGHLFYLAKTTDALRFSEDSYLNKPSQTYIDIAFDSRLPKTETTLTLWLKNITAEKTCRQKSLFDNPIDAQKSDLTSTLVCNPSGGTRQLGITLLQSF